MSWSIFGESPENDVLNYMAVEPDGSININQQDQTTPPIALYFSQAKGAPVGIVSDLAIDNDVVTVTDPTNFAVGDYVGLLSGDGSERFYFGEVVAISGAQLTMDTPFDYAFKAATASAISSIRDMNVLGSLASPQIFSVRGAPASRNLTLDVTRINVSIVSTSQPDDGNFGGIARLVNGVVLRRKNGDIRNIWNVKDGSDFGIQSGIDVSYSSRSFPQGSYGTKVRITYAGSSKHGVALRLLPGDFLELWIQDDLTELTNFRVMAQGHIATEGTSA